MNTACDSVSAAASARPCDRNEQRVADGHFGFRADAVHGPQRLDLHPEFRGDLLQCLAVPHPVRLPRHERLVGELQLGGEQLGLVDGQQDRVVVGPGDDRAVVLRIEVQELVDRHLGELRRHLDVDLARPS